jgi:hypothetical protein
MIVARGAGAAVHMESIHQSAEIVVPGVAQVNDEPSSGRWQRRFVLLLLTALLLVIPLLLRSLFALLFLL